MERELPNVSVEAEAAYHRLVLLSNNVPSPTSRVKVGYWIEEIRRQVSDLAYYFKIFVDVRHFAMNLDYLHWSEDQSVMECSRLKKNVDLTLERIAQQGR